MQRTYIHIPDKLKLEIDLIAKQQQTNKATIIRQALETGLQQIKPPRQNSAKALLELAKMAEKIKVKGPKDLAINHDYYAWGGPKRDPKAEV